MRRETRIFFMIIGLLVTMFLFWFYLNYLKDYSSRLKKVAKPMRNNVTKFYEENKRYPDYRESQSLLKVSGCTDIKRAYDYGSSSNRLICTFDVREILVDIYTGSSSNPYKLTFTKELSYCVIYFENNGKASLVDCHQLPLFRFNA